MELRYLLADIEHKNLLFIVSLAEEMKLRTLFERRSISAKITDAGHMLSAEERIERRLERRIFKADTWVVTSEKIESDAIAEMICKAYLSGKRVLDLESFLLKINPSVPANDPNQLIHHLAKNGIPQNAFQRLYTSFKYLIEPVVALILLGLLSPFLILIAIAIKLTSPGPVIYSQARLGYLSNVFKIYKFRSMRTDAEVDGPVWASTQKNDARLTPIGNFLRATHLDELPQLWNIVKGELSFIGPRPERPEFVNQLQELFPLFKLRSLVKPGITGWAQIKQGYANSFGDSLRKLEFDLFYMIKRSPVLDLMIFIGTFSVLFSGGTENIKRTQSPNENTRHEKEVLKAS
jgi:lipopolysaccharide/colanic/teichoic acid biosynthesis glycosyltransferase